MKILMNYIRIQLFKDGSIWLVIYNINFIFKKLLIYELVRMRVYGDILELQILM